MKAIDELRVLDIIGDVLTGTLKIDEINFSGITEASVKEVKDKIKAINLNLIN